MTCGEPGSGSAADRSPTFGVWAISLTVTTSFRRAPSGSLPMSGGSWRLSHAMADGSRLIRSISAWNEICTCESARQARRQTT